MTKPVIFLSLLLFPMTLPAQKSVTEYTSAQRAALQQFLDANPTYQFIPETWFDEETLSVARTEWGFGKTFKPYYQTDYVYQEIANQMRKRGLLRQYGWRGKL